MIAPSPPRVRHAVGGCPQVVALCAAVLFGGAGCGADSGPPPSPPLTFSADPDQIITSDSGALTIAVRFAPDPPILGSNAAELRFTDESGATVSNLGLTVVPWMPAHGHGTSVEATVTETAPGVFVATPVYLFMPGSWELRMTITGSVDDTAKAAFEIQ
jgi:hypothetical protein